MPLLCVGLSHRTAPLPVLERLALGPAARSDALSASWLREEARAFGLGEVAFLSTCNRVELYAAAQDPSQRFRLVPPGVASLLARACQVDPGMAEPYLHYWAGSDAARHLCCVAAGLESMVVGETDVLGQVAEAREDSVRVGAAGPILDAAFRTAVRAGRRARSETGISRHPASVASEAVRLIREWRSPMAGLRVVVVGTGRMGRTAAEVLRAKGVVNLKVVGRTLEHARAVCEPLGATALPWHELESALRQADVVLTSTAAPHAVITRELIDAVMPGRRPERPLLLVDIALPRDVAAEVHDVPGVEVVDLDQLQQRIGANLQDRTREIPRVEGIITEELTQFETWRQGAELRPVLAGLHARAEEIRRHELERALRRIGRVDPDLRQQIEALTSALVGRLLDGPSRRLRAESDPERVGTLARAVSTLFGLPSSPSDGLRDEVWPEA